MALADLWLDEKTHHERKAAWAGAGGAACPDPSDRPDGGTIPDASPLHGRVAVRRSARQMGDAAEMETFAPEQDPRAFRTTLGSFATGVTVVTARGPGGEPVGITANSFASVSLDPPLVLWSPARSSRRFAAFAEAGHFAIHVLAQDQQAVCDAFVRAEGGFDAVPWSEGPEGLPLLDGCLARFLCRREALLDGGDHAILLGRVWAASRRDGAPLVFQSGRYGGFLPAEEPHPSPDSAP